MVTIQNVDVTFEVEGDDNQQFIKHFLPAVNRWYREVMRREHEDQQSREDQSLTAPVKR